MPLLQRKRFLNLNHAGVYASAPGGGGYTGPVDAVPGATHWYGLRGVSAAYATGSNPAIDVVDQAGANQLTVNILSDGTLDLASISTWVTANSVSTVKVKKIYDQVGTLHLSQATLATMPVLLRSSVTDLAANRPTMQFSGAQVLTVAAGLTQNQPLTLSSVAQRTGAFTSFGGILGSSTTSECELQFSNSTNTAFVYAGAAASSGTAADSQFHGIQGRVNQSGGNSIVNVDGTNGSGASIGTGVFANGFAIGCVRGTVFMTGYVSEGGLWNSALSDANMTSLNTNQQAYWGY